MVTDNGVTVNWVYTAYYISLNNSCIIDYSYIPVLLILIAAVIAKQPKSALSPTDSAILEVQLGHSRYLHGQPSAMTLLLDEETNLNFDPIWARIEVSIHMGIKTYFW